LWWKRNNAGTRGLIYFFNQILSFMENKKNKEKIRLELWGLIDSLGVAIYVFIVSRLISSGQELFGKMEKFWGPFVFLLLFVLSAAVVGLLVFGRVAYFYLEGYKKESISLLFYTVGWLFLFTSVILLICILA